MRILDKLEAFDSQPLGTILWLKFIIFGLMLSNDRYRDRSSRLSPYFPQWTRFDATEEDLLPPSACR
jgi:hypothetical protein